MTTENQQLKQKQGCFDIVALPDNNLTSIRALEKQQNLNTQ